MPSAGPNPIQGFARRDWALVVAVALMWGSSFLWIKVGVGELAPSTVAWFRLLFGAATLACFPAAWRPIRRADRGLVAVLGLVWMAVPFVLFAVAEQTIPSALAGMINGASPLFTAAIAAAWSRRLPGRVVLLGLVIGFCGVLLVNLPATGSGGATMLGVGLVLLATVLYGVAFNMAGPLEDRNGVLPVIWRAQLVALVANSPLGIVGLAQSPPGWSSFLAMVVLGVVSTGLAFAAFTTLISRVGPTRGSVTVYLVPVVAIILGVTVRGEPIAVLSIVGIAIVLFGAFLIGRNPGTPAKNGEPSNRHQHDHVPK